ncbi:hypothetical protein A2U94_14830 [Bacillus sp. VT 712]|uniref:Uncharacterized protein n=1 Tax=Priestia veravalensis TaxID=1414648 RepID=A0A0V8JI64_9BACI|nr:MULTISPECIES: hypothetical protein [Bacillaceae]OZT13647.1 hypothetical protein CHN50_03470 [Priestia aryabhattai]USY53352.1 hypothetical protein NIZ91_11330 [Bacillus sp. 1780r2a1]KSU86666.1 hypothetical protein AS180_17375 [Priestia veravalensis]KZB90636.1 hypothetical protein A2U94_14830 [Bacillus sp. VT 712]MCA1201962.1 hypothetical protein [Priestia flexa]
MNSNLQTSKPVKVVVKKKLTIRSVLNLYGIFAIAGMLLSIFTTLVSLNENMELYLKTEEMLKGKKLKEFLAFIFGSAVVYFSLVNIYYYFLEKKHKSSS